MIPTLIRLSWKSLCCVFQPFSNAVRLRGDRDQCDFPGAGSPTSTSLIQALNRTHFWLSSQFSPHADVLVVILPTRHTATRRSYLPCAWGWGRLLIEGPARQVAVQKGSAGVGGL